MVTPEARLMANCPDSGLADTQSEFERRRTLHDQTVFHALIEFHGEIRRHLEALPNGFEVTTTSNNPEVVGLLHDHTESMRERLEQGRVVRRWDPLYAELFRWWHRVRMDYELRDNGVRARLTSDDAHVIGVIHAHGEAMGRFLMCGIEAFRAPSPLPEETEVSAQPDSDCNERGIEEVNR